jgi:hypothetical protein
MRSAVSAPKCPKAELEQSAVEAKVIVAFADDEGLVVGRVPLVARAAVATAVET